MKYYFQLFNVILFLIIISLVCYSADPFWDLAMVPSTGLITDIQVSHNNIIYISSENGVFSSTNNGNSWDWIFNGYTNTISLDSEDIIVSQGYSIGDQWRNLFISFDRGKAWKELIGPWSSIYGSYPTAHYFDNHILYILNKTRSDFKPSISGYQLYFTKDYGKSWDSTDNFKTFGTWNFEFDLFKVNGQVVAVRSKNDTTSLGELLYISRNLGKIWKLVQGPFSYIYDINIIDSLNYFIATNNGIYNTSNGGENWNLFAFQGIEFNKLLVSNDCKTIISAYSKGLFYSTDTGKTWNKTKDTFDLRYFGITAIAHDSTSNYYVAAEFYGIYKTENLTGKWEQINNGFSSWPIFEIAFNKNKDIILTSSGIYKSTTENWKEWKYLGHQKSYFGPIAFDEYDNIFIGNTNPPNDDDRGLYLSSDKGNSWVILHNGLGSFVVMENLIINKKGILFCTIGGGAICRSNDKGDTWEFMQNVHGTRLSINDEDHIFVFHSGTIFRSTNDGDSWYQIFHIDLDPISDDYSEKIIFNNKTKTAYYGPVGYGIQGSFEYGNLKTTDNGRTWFKDSSNYDDSAVFHFRAVDSLYCWIGVLNGDRPWAEKYKKKGIYRSCDNGLNWSPFDTTGLKHSRFGPISVSPNGFIFVSGENGGLYRSRDKFVSVKEKPKPSDDIIVTPNPATDFIEVQNPNYEKVSIMNILGETIYTTEAKKIDVSSYPTGIYLVRVGDRINKFVKL